jgi:transcriptional regulator with XRE-family HTH domain
MVTENVPEMIRGLRVDLGLTQEQFAAKVGVTYTTVNRWENSKGQPSPLAMLRIEGLQKKLARKKKGNEDEKV